MLHKRVTLIWHHQIYAVITRYKIFNSNIPRFSRQVSTQKSWELYNNLPKGSN